MRQFSFLSIFICTTSLLFATVLAANSQQLAANDATTLIANNTAPPIGPAASAAAAPAVNPDPQSSSRPLIAPVHSVIEVNGTIPTITDRLSAPYHITRNEVLTSAGTWGDFARYLQIMPGTVWSSDFNNEIMVRGGSSSENLYVVDGIEVPNIDHIALEGSTGGFTSMIDTATIGSVDMKPGAYDSSYSGRLSSLIDIKTRDNTSTPKASEIDFGISGIGGFMQRPLGSKASLLLAAHHGVLDWVTKDIGLNGVPSYTNGLAQSQWSPNSKDHMSALVLSGADALDINPDPCDAGETLRVQTQYAGNRSTGGAIWQHIYSRAFVSSVTASYSSQGQNIAQQLQDTSQLNTHGCATNPAVVTPAYMERTHDGLTTLGYGIRLGNKRWLTSIGTSGRLVDLDYNVAQPVGQLSPFNASQTWSDVDNFDRDLLTRQSAVYAETSGTVGTRLSVIAGAREELFALTSAHVFEPRAAASFRITGHQSINASYSQTGQLAPNIDIVSYPGNSSLPPLRVHQLEVGADLWRGGWATVSTEAYRKHYYDEPVSMEYPSLMLATMIDFLGQQFVWLPLKTGGHGHSQGIELLIRAHAASRLDFLGSVTYSRTFYAAADNVMRAGNFDVPLVANGMASLRLPLKLQLSARNTYTTGRPYTPFDILDSEIQSRGIYDLSKVNAVRGAAYDRVDADFNRSIHIHRKSLNLYGGLENVLNRQNFLGLAWEDNCEAPRNSTQQSMCGNLNAVPGVPETKLTEMPRYPSAGARLLF